ARGSTGGKAPWRPKVFASKAARRAPVASATRRRLKLGTKALRKIRRYQKS
ncbi:hypothetical protein CONLIGDRAFT_572988, partial [Coniochaeta ligniaria NRRL 30616]